jgi:peroxiredoxin
MPTTVLIDRDGNMRYLHKGYKPGYENDYEQQIKELIRE